MHLENTTIRELEGNNTAKINAKEQKKKKNKKKEFKESRKLIVSALSFATKFKKVNQSTF